MSPSRQPAPPTERKTLAILRELLALQECGTMSAAARQLGIPLATLARDLRELHEAPPGEALLVQEKKSWRLTPRGEAALPAIRSVVRQYEQLVDFLTGTNDQPRILRIGLGNFAAQQYFPQVLLALRRRADEALATWSVEPQVRRGRERILAVHDGHLDLALVTHSPDHVQALLAESRHDSQPLVVAELFRHPLGVVARRDSSAGSTLAEQPPSTRLPLKALANIELVGLDPQSGIRHRLTEELRKIQRDPAFVSGTGVGGWYAAKEFARAGLGAAVVPLAVLLAGDQHDLVLRHLASDVWMPEYVVHRQPFGDTDAAIAELIEVVKGAGAEFCRLTLKRWSGTS